MVVPMGIDEHSLFPADTHQTKPLDFGSDGCTCSLALNGKFLTIQTPHSQHGQMLAAPWQQFPPDKAHDQPYVRQYRALPIKQHTLPSAGFGMSIAGEPSSSRWTIVDGSWPRHHTVSPTHTVETQYIAIRSGVYTLSTITNTSNHTLDLSAQLDFPISVHRAAYTQLTPKGDCSIPPCENDGSVQEGMFRIVNRHLGATFTATVSVNGRRAELSPYAERSALPLSWSHSLPISIEPGAKVPVVLCCTLCQDTPFVTKPRQSLASLVNQDRFTALFDGLAHSSDLAFAVLRNIDYILGCCLVPLGARGTCVITDHQCLPLGWNRDNYWQMKMLHGLHTLADRVGNVDLQPYLESIFRRHLVWVYDTAQRPSGHWARCYLTNGVPKDDIFQLDQQCYPLLELTEFAELVDGNPSDHHLIARLAREVDPILENLAKHRCVDERDIWLFKTDETPGDDEVVFPYHFSSHILLWHTLKSLGRLQERVGADIIRTPVNDWAARVHDATMEHFIAKPDDEPSMFAYLTSTTGSYQFYHDANDLPTILAPRWGFCDSTNPEWRNTIEFAFSKRNQEGYYPTGPFGGLGSVHTRDPWPLGDGQALVMAIDRFSPQFTLDQVLNKLYRAVQWDGMFSEAVDGESGKISSKHWFSWPGSFIGYILMTWADQL